MMRAAAVRSNPDYQTGTPVCFGSYWSGSSGTAQQLANELGVLVYVPTRPVAWDKNSEKWIVDTDYYPNDSLPNPDIKPEWKIFYPNRNSD